MIIMNYVHYIHLLRVHINRFVRYMHLFEFDDSITKAKMDDMEEKLKYMLVNKYKGLNI